MGKMTEFRKHGKFPITFAERNPIPPFFLLLYYIQRYNEECQ